jgi:phosphoribosyl-ATP pyrophosphohydrolase
VSKSDNIKRAKLLRQRKREREKGMKQADQLEKDQKMLLENAVEEGYEIVDRSVLGRKEKISSLLLEMIYPLLNDAYNEDEVLGIVSFGLVA